jgi:hypothetical protein
VPIEGELIVRLERDSRHLTRVAVRLTRPMAAARVLAGRSAADAAATMPLLYSLCGQSQGAAAACALAAAGARDVRGDPALHDDVVMLESVQDTFRHLLIDGLAAMATAPCAAPVAAARAAIGPFLRAAAGSTAVGKPAAKRALGKRLSGFAADAIFGMPIARWRSIADTDALLAWCSTGGTAVAAALARLFAEEPTLGRSTVPQMPPAQGDTLHDIVVPAMRADRAFERAPTWAGSPVETGALARMRNDPLVADVQRRFGNAVGTRIVARLAELAGLIEELTGAETRPEPPARIQGIPLGDGEGLAAVETARGLLLHRARLREERVVDYQIVAPTEWNFHPEGALPRGLEGFEPDDELHLLRAARLAVHALDPCVGSRIEVRHA